VKLRHCQSGRPAQRGSALIITLWVAFGLVALALYFGNSSSLDLRAADNRAASLEAEQAIEGAARYAAYLLGRLDQPGLLPDVKTYQCEAAAVGDASFWFIGRDPKVSQITTDLPYFSLVDEASKLNLNTVTAAMLELLPRMTPELAGAIVDWRDADSDLTEMGAEEETYLLKTPAYYAKNAPFESVDELRLVNGADAEILYGEDLNRNGVLDLNENDSNVSLPLDDRNGRLDPGVVEYLTAFTKEPLTTTNGTARVNIRQNTGENQELRTLLEAALGTSRANEIMRQLGPGGGGGQTVTFNSVLEFYTRSRMTADEFALIEGDIYSAQGNAAPQGLININTASEQVLACVPGIGTELAGSLVGYRQANSGRMNTVTWAAEILGPQNSAQAGRYLTGRSYQFTADIAAVGHLGRGYRRTRFVFDTSTGTPRIIYRQDLSDFGWALGKQARLQQQQLAMNSR
jgi:type II secretory pathway component PulK